MFPRTNACARIERYARYVRARRDPGNERRNRTHLRDHRRDLNGMAGAESLARRFQEILNGAATLNFVLLRSPPVRLCLRSRTLCLQDAGIVSHSS